MDDIKLVVHRNGYPEETHFSFFYTPVRHDTVRVEGVFCACTETTQTFAGNREQREVETRNRQILDSAVDYAIIATDLDGNIARWNAGAHHVLQWSESEVLGQSIELIFTPEDRAKSRPWVEMRHASETGVGNDERWHIRKSGERFWASGEMTPLKNGDGDTVGFVKVLRDRTEQQLAARKLRESEARSREELEAEVAARTADRNRLWTLSTDIMLIARFDGTITATNPAWSTLLGWAESDLLGTSFLKFAHPDDLVQTEHVLGQLVTGTKIFNFKKRCRHQDGSYRWVTWIAIPDENFIHAVGRDITAEIEQAEVLARTEEALHQSQKMEAVGQLTGGLAHDFNNMLAAITGNLELLGTRLRQRRLEGLERYVATAHAAAARAASITHRLLAFSRRQTLDPKHTNVNMLVAEMEELIQRTVGPAIKVVTMFESDLWTILCDPHQLESAVLNLCINARDAMGDDGGQLVIETANASLDEAGAAELDMSPGQYIEIRVIDSGIGMAPEVAARAFDPFFTTKPLGMGTGLGLSMTYGFAKQSGGQVRLQTAPDKGTTVHLYLPRNSGVVTIERPKDLFAEAAQADQGETVLVVDDEPPVLMLVKEVLEELGYVALEAMDGASGLKILQSDARIDLLISDVGLPGGMNGRQMADAARLCRPDLKVLFITGYAQNAILGNTQLERNMHVLVKPFGLDTLAKQIKSLIKDEALAGPI